MPGSRGVISSQASHHPGLMNTSMGTLIHQESHKPTHSNTSQPLSHAPSATIVNGGHGAHAQIMQGPLHNQGMEGNLDIDRKSPGLKAVRMKAKEHSVAMGLVRSFQRC